MAIKKLKGHLAGYLPINFIAALSALGIVVIYSRLLTPEQYGRYVLAVTVIQWLQTLFFYWMHSGVARFYEADRVRGQLPTLLTTAYATGLGLIGFLTVVVGVAAAYLSDPWRWLVVAGLASLVARSLLLINLEAHRAARQVWRYTGLEGIQYVISLGLGVLLVLNTNGNTTAILWGTALACLFALLLDIPCLLRLMHPPAWSTIQVRRLAYYGWPLAASAMLMQIMARSDRFFIAWLMDEKAVGIYSVTYALVDRPSIMIFSWVGMAVVPLAFAAMEREGPAAARQVMEKTGKTLILLLLPSTAGLAAVATPLATVMFGHDFRAEAARLIPWIALASLLYGAMVHYVAHAFMITENTRLLLFVNIIVVILNMGFNWLLIPFFGLDGAVAASIITYTIGLGLGLILARQFFPVPLVIPHLIRGFLASGVMVAIIRAVAIPATLTGLILSILLGVISYSISALLFNVADSRHWLIARWQQWEIRQAAQ